jgi:hypothetical protein
MFDSLAISYFPKQKRYFRISDEESMTGNHYTVET